MMFLVRAVLFLKIDLLYRKIKNNTGFSFVGKNEKKVEYVC